MAELPTNARPQAGELQGRFLKAVRAAVRAALPSILAAHSAPTRAATTKSDGSLVTSTDRDVERLFISALRESLPGVPVVAEESEAERIADFAGSAEEFYSLLFAHQSLVVVDPIDGTKNFVEGRNEFCIAAALVSRVEGGVWPTCGVVGIPLEDRMVWTDGASVKDECVSSGEVRELTRDESEAQAVSVSSADRRCLSEHRLELLHPWVSSGSSVYDMLGTVTGRLKGSIIGSQRLWDVMAPVALADALGLALRDLSSGERVRAIVPQDLSAEISGRPWGLARKFAIVPADRGVSEVVATSAL